MSKKKHHDIEDVLEKHVSSGRRGTSTALRLRRREHTGAPERREKKKTKKPKQEKPQESEEFETKEEKQDYIEEQLEEIGEAIEDEVDEHFEKELLKHKKEEEEPVAVFVKDKETAGRIDNLKKAVSDGFETTQKNVVVFYEQASEAGNRVRGFIYVLLGVSIMFTGFFAKDIAVVNFKQILVALTNTLVGRVIVFTIGFSLFAYGTQKFFKDFWLTLKKKFLPKKKPKFVQKRLV